MAFRRRKHQPEPAPEDAMTWEAAPKRPPPRLPVSGLLSGFEVVSHIDELARTVMVEVSGAVDAYTAPRLREHMIELVAAGGWDNMVMDLRDLDFLDSAGLGVLVGGSKRLRGNGMDMVLIVNQPRILRILEITGAVKHWLVVDDPSMLD